MSATGDPRMAVSAELERWHDQARELCDPDGTVVRLIHEAQVELERTYTSQASGAFQRADMKVLQAFWAVLGAHETVVYSYRQLSRDEDAVLCAWKLFRELAGIVLHNMSRLDEELRRFLARDGIAPTAG